MSSTSAPPYESITKGWGVTLRMELIVVSYAQVGLCVSGFARITRTEVRDSADYLLLAL